MQVDSQSETYKGVKMQTYARLKAAVDNYEMHAGKRPETLILDSFFHESLKIEMKEGPEDSIGELKNIFGIPIFIKYGF